MAPSFYAKTFSFSSCTEVGLKALKKKKKKKYPLAFQSILSGFFRSSCKGAIGLLGQDDPVTNLYDALRLCTDPSRQQVPIKYLSAKWISRLPTVSHLALTSLSDYRLCLPWAVSREAVRRHVWGGARGDMGSGRRGGFWVMGLGHLPGEKMTWWGGDGKDQGVCLGASEGTWGHLSLLGMNSNSSPLFRCCSSAASPRQSPREADCVCLLCTALQYTNRLT